MWIQPADRLTTGWEPWGPQDSWFFSLLCNLKTAFLHVGPLKGDRVYTSYLSVRGSQECKDLGLQLVIVKGKHGFTGGRLRKVMTTGTGSSLEVADVILF